MAQACLKTRQLTWHEWHLNCQNANTASLADAILEGLKNAACHPVCQLADFC